MEFALALDCTTLFDSDENLNYMMSIFNLPVFFVAKFTSSYHSRNGNSILRNGERLQEMCLHVEVPLQTP